MKHIQGLTKTVPAPAICVEGHPDLKTSIQGFLADPLGTLMMHLGKTSG